MGRSFRHLSRAEISQIVSRFSLGETKAELARAFNVDHSTIIYHLDKYERAYPEQGGIYAFIKVEKKKSCLHPSARCTLCSEMWDKLERQETEHIRRLRGLLAEANSRLRIAGEDPVVE